MKVLIVMCCICFFYKISYCQKFKSNPYTIGFAYISKSDSVKKRISNIMDKGEFDLCNKNETLLYVCPNIQFVDLSEYREQLLPYSDSLSLDKQELNNRITYRKNHFFEAYVDSSLCKLNVRKNQRYCAYTSFSKMAGRILPLIVFINDKISNDSPCELLKSIKFGNAIVIMLAFDSSYSKVENIFFEEVALN